MEILNYTEDHRIFRNMLRKFLEKEVIPYANEWEKAGIVPKEVWKKAGEQGLLCMDVPEEYGGLGTDLLYPVIVYEELVRTGINGLILGVQTDLVAPYITSFGSEELKHKYLPSCVSGDIVTAIAMTEPDAGSDLASMRTTANLNGDHVIINGQKTFISNGINCDLVVLAVRDPSVEDPYRAMDLYLVEAGTPGFEKGRNLEKIGMHSQDTAELFFTDCRVPVSNRLGLKGTGFQMLMKNLPRERLMCAVWAVAWAEFILEMTIGYCKERKAFGKPISKFQHTQFKIVEMATEVKLGRTFVDKLIADHMEGKNDIVGVSMAKYWCTDMVNRVADQCLQLYGGYGYCEEYLIARAWRDMRILRIFAGTNEIMKNIAAKFMGL